MSQNGSEEDKWNTASIAKAVINYHASQQNLLKMSARDVPSAVTAVTTLIERGIQAQPDTQPWQYYLSGVDCISQFLQKPEFDDQAATCQELVAYLNSLKTNLWPTKAGEAETVQKMLATGGGNRVVRETKTH